MSGSLFKTFFLGMLCIGMIASFPASAQPAEDAAFHQDLCPIVQPAKSIRLNNRVLSVPQNVEQERDLIGRLHSPDREAAFRAVIALAMAGNIEAFHALLTSGDTEKLRIYCSYYQNSRKIRCVDPILEKAVINHFDDPALSEALLYLFRKNLYRSRVLFKKILYKKIDAKNTRIFELTINALVANRIPGVEGDVLSHAMAHGATIDRKLFWSVIPVDKDYLDFFIERNYAQCLEYIKKILNQGHYSTTPPPHRVHLYNRHRALYYQLDKFSSEEAGDIFISQLAKLDRLQFDNYYDMELEAAGRYSIKHAQTIDQRNRIVACLVPILQASNQSELNDSGKDATGRARGKDINDNIYGRVITLLGQTGTDAAASVLVKELARLAGDKDVFRVESKISRVMIALSTLPGTVSINIPDFLQAVGKLDANLYFSTVALILKTHPHSDGLDFLLSKLEVIVLQPDTFASLHPMDGRAAFNRLFDLLLAFDKPEYLFRTREVLDRLYVEKKLDQGLYETASVKINRLIGNESPVFAALQEQKAAMERERKQRQAAEEQEKIKKWYEEQIAAHMSPEGIRKDIQIYARSGGRERMAVSWLVMGGTRILPHVHQALYDEALSPRMKFKLITLLGIIGDTRSTGPILDVLRAHPDMIHKDVFLSLSQIPATDASYEFVDRQLRTAESPKIRQSALVCFAYQREQRAAHWIKPLTADGVDAGTKTAALFLSARLGRVAARDRIVSLLKAKPVHNEETVLLRALAELASPDELRAVIQEAGINPDKEGRRNALLLSGFRHAAGPEKVEAAEKLLASDYLWDRREAARYLIAGKAFERLEKYILVDARVETPYLLEAVYSHVGQLIILEASKMGWRIEDSDGGIVFKKRS